MKAKKYNRFIAVTVAFTMTAVSVLCGCSAGKGREKIELNVWVSNDEEEVVKAQVKEFEEKYSDEADIHIRVDTGEISETANKILSETTAGPDVFQMVDDQFNILKDNGALYPLDGDKDKIEAACGDCGKAALESVSSDGKLYGYPLSKSNGYCLFYNAKYLDEDQVKNLDTILEVAKNNKKYFIMDWSSGWYTQAFFTPAGKSVHISEKNKVNICNYNSTEGEYSGKDVAEAMVRIGQNPGFKNVINSSMPDFIKSGDVIAVVTGSWYEKQLKEAWGYNIRAAKLPSYTIKGKQLQMYGISSYKYMAVNAKTSYLEWSDKLALWLTGEDSQTERFKATGDCPAYTEAIENSGAGKSLTISALLEQEKYSEILSVEDPFWNAMGEYGAYVASGNPDNVDLQKLLDKTVKRIESSE